VNWDLELAEWLVGDDGRRWLETAAGLLGTQLQRVAKLRKQLSAEQTAAVCEQLDLRERGRGKFLSADAMFFTRQQLEQATDEVVANYKAARFAPFATAADLCCGIGGDLLAMATQSKAIGIDRDSVATTFAAANLAASGRAGRLVAETIDAARLSVDAWHIDPDRRPGGKRSVHVEIHEPGLAFIESLLERVPGGAIKLAPAAEPSTDWRALAECEWISRGGECKQLVVWFDALANRPGTTRATVLAKALDTPVEDCVLATVTGQAGAEPQHAPGVLRYLFEPDAAVLAADLVGALAEVHQLAAITPGIAYLTGDRPINDAALTCFEVVEAMPFRVPVVKSWLRERGVGRLEIKKRGVEEDPEKLRKNLKLAGDHAATLILLPIAGSVTAVFAQRVTENKNG
jgi:hypothetical protein